MSNVTFGQNVCKSRLLLLHQNVSAGVKPQCFNSHWLQRYQKASICGKALKSSATDLSYMNYLPFAQKQRNHSKK